MSQLAPGRFRLGVGPSHGPTTRAMYGFDFGAPLGHLKEYVQILKALLQEGAVDFDGKYYHAHASIPGPVDVPIMPASALRSGSFEACGAVGDPRAISWVCPSAYLENRWPMSGCRGLPGARNRRWGEDWGGVAFDCSCAGLRTRGPGREIRVAVQQQLSNYPRMPFYPSTADVR